MATPDVLVPNVHNLLWKKAGSGGWPYNGPIVFSAPDRFSRGELRQKVGNIVGCVPDDCSTLWVFCWADSFTEDEKVTVKEHLLQLPLRFRGQVYEECVSRAKGYLVDRLFHSTTTAERANVTWSKSRGFWTISAGDHAASLTKIVEDDPLVALATAVALVAADQ